MSAYTRASVVAFLRESNAIEGIHRPPTDGEVEATLRFLALPSLSLDDVCEVQAAYAPGKPLRTRAGMNVRIGSHLPPPGGPGVGHALDALLQRLDDSDDPWREHIRFETLHPFLDGNGRSGRALWAWHMLEVGRDPFALGFLHCWYYQTLENFDRGRP